mmetsp:Transcript_14132/g.45308  ORF Transcript_14132/g.45308 Transcript_14132/m.45308 type:complete len:234 (-) Transcript_14132:21-722(-)
MRLRMRCCAGSGRLGGHAIPPCGPPAELPALRLLRPPPRAAGDSPPAARGSRQRPVVPRQTPAGAPFGIVRVELAVGIPLGITVRLAGLRRELTVIGVSVLALRLGAELLRLGQCRHRRPLARERRRGAGHARLPLGLGPNCTPRLDVIQQALLLPVPIFGRLQRQRIVGRRCKRRPGSAGGRLLYAIRICPAHFVHQGVLIHGSRGAWMQEGLGVQTGGRWRGARHRRRQVR